MPRRKYSTYYNKKPSPAVVALNTIIIVLLSIVALLIGLYLFSYFSGYTVIPFDKMIFPWSDSAAVNSDEVKIIEPVSSYGTEPPLPDEPAPASAVISEETTSVTTEPVTVAVVVGETTAETTEISAVETEPRLQYNINDYSEEFYSNTLFVGDSIFTGFAAFEYLPVENVFAQVGLNPDSIMTKKINEVTVFEKAAAMQPERICIMLGTNGLAFLDVDYMAQNMRKVVDQLRAVCPDTEIALISIPPVTEEHEKENPENIPLIMKYNSAVRDVAEDIECRFIDIYSALTDEKGYFAKEYAEVDGLHFVGITYKLVLTMIQYEFTGDPSLVVVPEGYEDVIETVSSVTEAPETEAVTTDTTKFTVQVVVPDTALTTVTEVPVTEPDNMSVSEETVSETTVFTVEIIV